MSHTEVASVTYFADNGFSIAAERLYPEDDTDDVAHGALRLLTTAYSAQLEDGENTSSPIPAGTIEAFFRPEDRAAISSQADKMRTVLAAGGQYWLIKSAEAKLTAPFAGLLKVSPSKATWAQKMGIQSPNLFINDILVHPAAQRLGLGSAAFYTAVTFTDFKPGRVAALEVYDGNSVNRWFRHLGFKDVPRPERQVSFGDVRIAAHLLSTDKTTDLTTIGNRLQSRYQWLGGAIVIPADNHD